MMTNSYFNHKTAKLGDWVLALWKAGYKRDKAKKLGFPETYRITDKYSYASEMELRMFINGRAIFVDNQGDMFVYHKTKGVLEPWRRLPTELFDKPKPDKKGKKAVPATKPKPKAPPSASELLIAKKITGTYLVGLNEYVYRTKDNKWINYDGKVLDISKALDSIIEGEQVAGYFKVVDIDGVTIYIDKKDWSIHRGIEMDSGETIAKKYARLKSEKEKRQA